jgi:hypothetical protein
MAATDCRGDLDPSRRVQRSPAIRSSVAGRPTQRNSVAHGLAESNVVTDRPAQRAAVSVTKSVAVANPDS